MGGRTGMQSVYFMSPFHIFYERRLKMFFPMWLMGIDIPLTRRRHRRRWDIETLTTRWRVYAHWQPETVRMRRRRAAAAHVHFGLITIICVLPFILLICQLLFFSHFWSSGCNSKLGENNRSSWTSSESPEVPLDIPTYSNGLSLELSSISSWNSKIKGSSSSGPPPHHGAGMITPRPVPVCIVNGFSRNTPIIFCISFEALVAHSGTSVCDAKAWFIPLTERPKLGSDMEDSSMMKQSSRSSGSTLTEDSGGEVCLDSVVHWVAFSGSACISKSGYWSSSTLACHNVERP